LKKELQDGLKKSSAWRTHSAVRRHDGRHNPNFKMSRKKELRDELKKSSA
jgi:hypothetical protein